MENLLRKIIDKLDRLDQDVQTIKSTMATKSDISDLKTSIESKHIENINSDNVLLKAIKDTKESIRFVNRRISWILT